MKLTSKLLKITLNFISSRLFMECLIRTPMTNILNKTSWFSRTRLLSIFTIWVWYPRKRSRGYLSPLSQYSWLQFKNLSKTLNLVSITFLQFCLIKLIFKREALVPTMMWYSPFSNAKTTARLFSQSTI